MLEKTGGRKDEKETICQEFKE